MRFPPTTILVPTDFSREASTAVDYAFDMAATVRAQVHLLHVYHVPVFSEAGPTTKKLIDDLQSSAEATLTEAVRAHASKGVTGQLVVKDGDARDVILQSAVELRADLIIMGTHGRQGFKRMLLGSVAEAVVRSAPCNVLVIRPR